MAGFTTGNPWIRVNENHHQINAAAAEADPGSVLQYFRRMVKFRKRCPALVYGSYQLLDSDANVYAYLRADEQVKLLVLLNFSKTNTGYQLGYSFDPAKDVPINNYPVLQLKEKLITLLPYQATMEKLRRQLFSMGERGSCVVPGSGKLAADRAAQYFTALIRYPDFMDNYLGKEATCHPSDNIGSLLAAAQLRHITGMDFLKAMALGYEMECRLVEEIPVMMKGFDHTVVLAYSLTAALCQVLQLTPGQTTHALSIAGCSQNPLVSCRASYTYEWKGFASSLVALNCMNIVLLAREGMTGPLALFEGPKGFKEIYGMELDYDWKKEDFSLIKKCILKTFNSEVHTQPSLEAAQILKKENVFDTADIREVDVTTFLTAYHIVGGGSYGDRKTVHSKEQADHSLPYALSAVLLDGRLYPEQLLPERILQPDIQELLQKVNVHTKSPVHKPLVLAAILDPYTEAYPEKLLSAVKIHFKNGKSIERENINYHGFHTEPLSWDETEGKFRQLTGFLDPGEQTQLVEVIRDFDKQPASTLTNLLAKISLNA